MLLFYFILLFSATCFFVLYAEFGFVLCLHNVFITAQNEQFKMTV